MNLAYNEYQNDFKRKVGECFDLRPFYNTFPARQRFQCSFNIVGNDYDVHSPFEWTIVTRNLVFMAAEGVVFFALTLLIEYNFFREPK